MPNTYPKGSEWYQWDLHIHTPKSIVQQFGGDTPSAWDAFVAKITSLPPEIKVIGITDYLFCDGYEHLLTRKDEMPNIELILPNIEFRLNTFSGTAKNTKRHNFHILFDPTVSIEDIRSQLLNCLSTGYKIEDNTAWHQTPTPRSLEELGRQIKSVAPPENSLHSKSDLEVGFDNITYKREDIEALLKKSCFQGRFVTAVGYSEWDQSRWDQSAAEKRDLINSSNFSLTCSDDPARIDENRQDLKTNSLNSLILHSSDSHDLTKVGKTMLWIKADPTFSGLKQVLNEPDSRVFIGETPPNYKPDHKVITSILIPSSNGWFADNFQIELNRDLVAVIGGRGSGKSALAEALAYGAGSQDESDDSFLKKATKHVRPIKGTEITLCWADGSNTQFKVGELTDDQGRIRYLSQGVVEELCSPKSSDKLQEQIENVIFQALDDADRMGASDFRGLRDQLLINFQHEKEQIIRKVRQANAKLGDLSRILASLPEKEKTLQGKREELETLRKSLPTLPPEDIKGQEELISLVNLKKKFSAKIVEVQSLLAKITEVGIKVKIFQGQITDYQNETLPLLTDLGISETSMFFVQLDDAVIKAVFDKKKSEYQLCLKTIQEGTKEDVAKLLALNEADLPFANLHSLNKGIEEKQNETRAFETSKLKYQQQMETISATENLIKALENEIEKITTVTKPEIERYQKARMACYCSYFEVLGREMEKIKQLYAPLQNSLDSGTDTDKKLLFEAKIAYRLDAHVKAGLSIIDRSRKGNFREQGNIKSALSGLWDEFSRNNFDITVLQAEINKIVQAFTTFENAEIRIVDQLRDNNKVEDFFNWLLDPSHFEIVSSLQFDGTDLYLLSPGQKGIILLMLFLEIDKTDYRPLIIDQPEENLDNLSVYKDLINYFRERKKYRQIVIVTHNPNLVVNTDAEQVIIANYEGKRTPRLSYSSGSLENQIQQLGTMDVEDVQDGIIERVCNILEGGPRAFEKRKRKYQISPHTQM